MIEGIDDLEDDQLDEQLDQVQQYQAQYEREDFAVSQLNGLFQQAALFSSARRVINTTHRME